MIRRLAIVSLLVLGVAGCQRPPAATPFTPGLGEIMTLTQMRHLKLWLAGQNANWPLARYELDELQEGMDDAAKFHPAHKDAAVPLPRLIEAMIKPPLDQLDDAVRAENPERFVKAFDALTQGCNACHQATKFGFNVVTRPTTNPYTNQAFRPAR